ncbi:MAG TPA: M23 family metallopeptidase [Spirochaetales bacterium]|nr:M23 family metallopeptidase [Spirochaetales bacterium]
MNRERIPLIRYGLILYFITAFLAPVQFAFPQEKDRVRVYPKIEGETYTFYGDNDFIIPVWISIDFTALQNFKSSVSFPFRTLLQPSSRGTPLFYLDPLPGTGRKSYRMVVSYARGDPDQAKPDPGFLYLFPFSHGSKYRMTQGPNGSFTHQGENQYAYDFDLEMGIVVTAARDGLVVDVKTDSNRGGPSTAYARDANYILILHEDGTFGHYVHLKQNGSRVKVGDRVQAGDPIGYSGNTGVSSGPHLHFDVRIPNRDGKMVSIPIQFLNFDGSPLVPEEGEYYYAFHPGKPPFPIVRGKDLQESHFASYEEKVQHTGKIDVRFEQVDATYVVYLRNGLSTAQEISVEFRLQNMTSIRQNPITVTVPGETEVFLTLLRALPGATAWEYGYTLRYRPASNTP